MTETEARARGADMMRQLKGTGWKLDVWDNLGWHCAAYNKFISVHEYNGKYSAMLTIDPDKRGCGETYWTDSRHFDDPQEAVKWQMKIATAYLRKMRNAIEHVEATVLLY